MSGAAQKSGEAPQFSIVEQLKSSWWRAPERTRVFVGVPNFFFVLRVHGRRRVVASGGGGGSSARSTITLGRPSFPRFVLRCVTATQHSVAAPTSHYKLCCGCSSLFFYLDSSLDAAAAAVAGAAMVLVLA